MGQGLEDAKAMLRYLMKKRELEQAQEQKDFIAGGGRLGDGSETPIPGAAAMKRKVDDTLTEYVVEPLAARGHEGLGAAIATVPSVIADVVLPDTVGELAMPPPIRGGGKVVDLAAKRAEKAAGNEAKAMAKRAELKTLGGAEKEALDAQTRGLGISGVDREALDLAMNTPYFTLRDAFEKGGGEKYRKAMDLWDLRAGLSSLADGLGDKDTIKALVDKYPAEAEVLDLASKKRVLKSLGWGGGGRGVIEGLTFEKVKGGDGFDDYVILKDGEVIGQINVTNDGSGKLVPTDLWVAEGYRGRGVATEAGKFIERELGGKLQGSSMETSAGSAFKESVMAKRLEQEAASPAEVVKLDGSTPTKTELSAMSRKTKLTPEEMAAKRKEDNARVIRETNSTQVAPGITLYEGKPTKGRSPARNSATGAIRGNFNSDNFDEGISLGAPKSDPDLPKKLDEVEARLKAKHEGSRKSYEGELAVARAKREVEAAAKDGANTEVLEAMIRAVDELETRVKSGKYKPASERAEASVLEPIMAEQKAAAAGKAERKAARQERKALLDRADELRARVEKNASARAEHNFGSAEYWRYQDLIEADVERLRAVEEKLKPKGRR